MIGQKDIIDNINGIATLVSPVKTHYLWRPILCDPNDETVLEVAVNGGADAIAVAEKISALETERFFAEQSKTDDTR